ncbi:MAG: hypothetical protein NVSMB27_12850 [Ktedonobacteraceae bacterium]
MMHSLSTQEILRIWEIGSGQHPVDRALTMLAGAFPEIPQDDLVSLSVGQRDARLLDIRKRNFGTHLASFTECVKCQERLEFDLEVDDIQVAPRPESVNQEYRVACDRYELHFRLPTSLDLAAIAGCPDVTTARKLLVRRCVLKVNRDGAEVSTEGLSEEVPSLPETVVTALGAQMATSDPMAEIEIDVTCPACGHHWSVIFDIVLFLWAEICVQAKRLLREVHTLAWAYGWHEADILSLSAARRQYYLEMVT